MQTESSSRSPFRELPLKIDESIFYYTIHTFIFSYLYNDSSKEMETKLNQLENFGERLGICLNERVSLDFFERLGKEKSDIKNLEFIKYICKEIWTYVFGKPIDKLQTNHKGTFYLTDLNFKFFSRMDCNKEEQKYFLFASTFIRSFIRGILLGFQLESEVNMESRDNKGENEFSFAIITKEN